MRFGSDHWYNDITCLVITNFFNNGINTKIAQNITTFGISYLELSSRHGVESDLIK